MLIYKNIQNTKKTKFLEYQSINFICYKINIIMQKLQKYILEKQEASDLYCLNSKNNSQEYKK